MILTIYKLYGPAVLYTMVVSSLNMAVFLSKNSKHSKGRGKQLVEALRYKSEGRGFDYGGVIGIVQ